MTESPRLVTVDDTDPGIQYTGLWSPDKGAADTWGNFGPPFNGTQHGTISNASLSYTFSGSQVVVIGSNKIRNDSGVIDPSWECFIDDLSIGTIAPPSVPENNCILCRNSGLPDGLHVLTVNVTVTKAQMFWIDALQYVPSPSVVLDQKMIQVNPFDPQIQYGSGWGPLNVNANMTSQQGSTFTFDFIGVSLTWFGSIPSDPPTGPSTATYSIDGQTPINFVLNGPNSSSVPIYHQKFFETGKLSPGSHRLSVVYTSTTNQSTPLSLAYLMVQNGTATATSSGTFPSSTGSSGSSRPTSGTGNSNVGPIVGGVVGGLVVICLIIVLLRRRRREIGDNEASSSRILEPYFASGPASTSNSHSFHSQGTQSMVASGSSSFPTSTNSGNITTQPPTRPSYPLTPKAQREAEAAAAALARRPAPLPAVPARSYNPGPPGAVMMHEDSGIRLPATPVLEVPPMYTPS